MIRSSAATTIIATLLGVAMSGSVLAAPPALATIIAKAYGEKGPTSMQAKMEMALIDQNGKSATRTLQIRRAGNNRQIVWFEAPANMRGTGFLRLADGSSEKMWLYLPAFKKLERIGAADEKRSFLGSDFAYADMAPHKLDRYNAALLGEGVLDGEPVYHVELSAKPGVAVLYGKIAAYVRTSDLHVVREDLYDTSGDLIKQKSYRDIKAIGGFQVPTVIEMRDLQRNHTTRLTMSDIKVGGRIPDRVFTTKFLEKIK